MSCISKKRVEYFKPDRFKNLQCKKISKAFIFSIVVSLFNLLFSTQHVFAATSASQTLNALLGNSREIVANGGNTTSAIHPSGNLTTTICPCFKVICSTSASQKLKMEATITDSSGPGVRAVYGDGINNYIILANTLHAPTPAAIADIIAGSTNPANNPNAIAFQVSNPVSVPGKLVFTWNPARYWDAELTYCGEVSTILNIPAGTAAPNTYSNADLDGTYQAVIVFTFL